MSETPSANGPDASISDPQTLRKILIQAAEVASERDPEEIARDARARAETDACPEAGRLAAVLVDPDWITPPSARRRIAAALTYFGDPESVPEAARSVPGPDLVRHVSADQEPELAAWEAFCGYRDRIDRRGYKAEGRARRLYARRQRLRARLQSRSPA
ncbi:MAG: hypothetical protein JRG76_06415 [Deltaproteobacteria bacterium]|nr:hypothetical protein [Deltaproteobacteria bacterium]MBW2414129.1 hypothetical protein [Deltaproteobacteria bacterium]